MRGFRVCLVAVSWVFSPDFCLHVWTFWGVLGARVGVFGGLGVLALVWLGLPCRFFPVSKLTKDRRVGGQRLEAVVAFAEDRLRLPSGFAFRGEAWGGETVEAGGMTLSQVRERYPYVARRFDTALIPVVHVKGDDDMLGECVSRLHGEMA